MAVLQDQVREFDQAHSGDERLTRWLNPTVNVLCAFNAAICGGVSLVSLNMEELIYASSYVYCRYFRLRTRYLQASVSSY
jgi:hypothetical protein